MMCRLTLSCLDAGKTYLGAGLGTRETRAAFVPGWPTGGKKEVMQKEEEEQEGRGKVCKEERREGRQEGGLINDPRRMSTISQLEAAARTCLASCEGRRLLQHLRVLLLPEG